jgi:broad specificity phosphatase PhoE
MRRVVLVRHASTGGVRRARFGADDPIDARGRREATALRGELPDAAEALAAPGLSSFQTASLAGCRPVRIEQALADCDYGRWTGLAFDDVARDEPDAARAWLSEPQTAPHGGESIASLLARIAAWLDDQRHRDGTVVAVAAAAVVRAAVVHALGAPAAAFWRIDIAPASMTELHARDGRWTVTRVNERAAPPHRRASTA